MGSASRRQKIAAAADDPNKVWDLKRPRRARREGVRRELRGVPPGERQGRAERVPGARRLAGRRPARRADQIHLVLNGMKDGKPTAMASWKQLSDADIAVRHHATRATAGATRPARRSSRRDVRRRAMTRSRTDVEASPRRDVDEHHPARPRRRHDHAPRRPRAPLPAGSCAGSRRPTTRTSARCTCGSRFTMFIVGGMMALTIRAELFQPGLQIVASRVLQLADDAARPHHDLRRDHAGARWASRTGRSR